MNGLLTPKQQAMVETWNRHLAAEFEMKNVEATMATMTSNPFVNHVPVGTGGVGFDEVRHFYRTWFLPCQPPDTEIVPVDRTVGDDRIVDELIQKFTHTIEMPWMLPGAPPTGKRVEVAVIVVVQFEGTRIAGERISRHRCWRSSDSSMLVGCRFPASKARARSSIPRGNRRTA